MRNKSNYNMKDYIGKVVLIRFNKIISNTILQYKVMNVSPSGRCVLLRNTLSGHFWEDVNFVEFMEQLDDTGLMLKFENKKPVLNNDQNE